MYGGMCTGRYMQSMIMLKNVCDQTGIDVYWSFIENESLIERARNALAHEFLKSDCTHFMFVDADIRFNAAEVPAMIQANVDVICGVYPKKEINWTMVEQAVKDGVPTDQLRAHSGSFVINLVNYAAKVTVPIMQPVEIWYGGTGFMMIQRTVMDHLAESVPTYNNDVGVLSGTIKPGDKIKQFFTCSIEQETGRLLSEDYHFCKIVRDAGFKIYAAPWVSLGHVGTYIFEGMPMRSP